MDFAFYGKLYFKANTRKQRLKLRLKRAIHKKEKIPNHFPCQGVKYLTNFEALKSSGSNRIKIEMKEVSILLETAASYCQKGDFKQGIHLYSKYIEQIPDNPIAFYQRGKAYFKLKDFNAALSDLTKTLSLVPDEAHYYGERGLIHYMAKNPEKAIADFDYAVELEPENPYRYASRAFIKDGLQDLDGAKVDYQKALELDPEDAISHNNLGLVLEKMGYRKKADKHFEEAGSLDPKNFGMRKDVKNTSDQAVPLQKKSPESLPEIKPQSKKLGSTMLDTLKGLAKSKEERREFWSFFKDKIAGK